MVSCCSCRYAATFRRSLVRSSERRFMPPSTCSTTKPNTISRATMAKKAPFNLVWTVKGALATSRGSQSFMDRLHVWPAGKSYKRRLPCHPEIILKFLDEGPVRMLVDKLLRVGLYHTDVPHAQRVKTDRVLGIVLPPPAIGYMFKLGQRMLILGFLDDLVRDKSPRREPGIAGDHIGCLEDCAKGPSGGNGVLLDEVAVPEHHAAEVLGPRFVNIGVYQKMTEARVHQFMRTGRKGHEGVDLAVLEQTNRLILAHPDIIDVRARVHTHIGHDRREENVRPVIFNSSRPDGLPLEVTDRLSPFAADESIAPHMEPGQEFERWLLVFHVENSRCGKARGQIDRAFLRHFSDIRPVPKYILNISESFIAQQRFGHIHGRVACRSSLQDPQPRCFGRRFHGSGPLPGPAENGGSACKREPFNKFP